MVVYTLISPSQSRICVYICYISNNVKKKESASANSVIAGIPIVSNHNCYHSHWPTTCSRIHIRGQTDLEQARTAQLFTPRAWDKCIRSATTPEQLGGPEQEWLSELYARFAFPLNGNTVGTLKKKVIVIVSTLQVLGHLVLLPKAADLRSTIGSSEP